MIYTVQDFLEETNFLTEVQNVSSVIVVKPN